MILTTAVKQAKHLLDCFYPQAYNFQTVIDGNLTEQLAFEFGKIHHRLRVVEVKNLLRR